MEAEAGADLSRNGRTLTAAVSVSNNSRTSVKMRSARLSKQTLSAHAAADQATPRSTWAQLQTCSKQKQCSHDASQANLNWNVPEIRPMSCQTQLHMFGNFKQGGASASEPLCIGLDQLFKQNTRFVANSSVARFATKTATVESCSRGGTQQQRKAVALRVLG